MPRRGLILAATLALGCVLTTVVALTTAGGPEPTPVAAPPSLPRADLPAFPLVPEETVSVRPKPSPSASRIPVRRAAAQSTSRPPATSAPPSPPASAPTPVPPAPPPPAVAPPPPAAALTAGTAVGLAPAGRPGFRVRHRDFAGRVDPVSADSGATDRADARFAVRAGRADPGCVSLESVNFPGYYLRHRHFQIHLDRADRTKLFDEDSTFCPEPISGGSLTLRAHNYPGHRVTAENDRLVLRESGATAFRPEPPL
ncbi:AbfB domain-containing protein [Actinoplanes sp. DH11]|uniref:AbfB domain-containing protein n=1 Tax=Actinoplanes sp. DH11 TaxID=2857011 RepID=UPI001E45D969|nr:AbfB domain-containing protein [Actinoplanes sp. DH11]